MKWYFQAFCPCGYGSKWYRREWIARIMTYVHCVLSGHKRGEMFVQAWDKVER